MGADANLVAAQDYSASSFGTQEGNRSFVDHCDLNAYSNNAERCAMDTYVQFRDGVVEFHYVMQFNGADSEYLGLRSAGGVQ